MRIALKVCFCLSLVLIPYDSMSQSGGKLVVDGPAPVGEIGSDIDIPSHAIPAVPFGTTYLNRDEAESIAEREGFEFYDLRSCSDDAESDCAVVTIENARGNAFDYYISPQKCALQPSGTVAGATTGTNGKKRGDFCFGPYKVGLRVRHHLFILSEEDGWVQNQTLAAQLPGSDRWELVSEMDANSWATGKISSGQERGWSHELRDAEGGVLSSDSETGVVIASSSNEVNDISINDKCEARKKELVAKQKEVVTLAEELCEFSKPFDEVTIGTLFVSLRLTRTHSGAYWSR